MEANNPKECVNPAQIESKSVWENLNNAKPCKTGWRTQLLWFIFELALVQIKYNYFGEKPPERYEGGGKPQASILSQFARSLQS